MRYFLIGFMGSGKSYWGKLLGEKLNIPFIDLDAAIEKEEGRTIAEIFESEGEEYFRIKETGLLEKLIVENEAAVISTGGGTPCFFNNIEKMRSAGKTIWLNTSVKVLTERLMKGREQRPLLKMIPDNEFKKSIRKKLLERRMYYDQAELVVDNESEISVEKFIEIIKA